MFTISALYPMNNLNQYIVVKYIYNKNKKWDQYGLIQECHSCVFLEACNGSAVTLFGTIFVGGLKADKVTDNIA